MPVAEGAGQTTHTFRKRVGDATIEPSISGNRLVFFEVRVDADGRATDIWFAPDTPAELQPLARKSIEDARFRRAADHTDADWISAITTVL